MTKNLFKWAMLVMTSLMLSLSFVSCGEKDNPDDPDNPDNPDQPGNTVLVLKEKSVEMKAEGGAAQVTYTIENPIEGEEVKVAEDAEWLSDFNTATANEISFTVAANDSYNPRSAEVTVTYSTVEASFKVIQAAQELPDEEMFTIEISNIRTTQFDAKVTPYDKEMTYLCGLLTKDMYESYEDDIALIEKDFEWYEYIAGQQGMTMEDVLPKLWHKGDYAERWSENTNNTDYVFFTYGVAIVDEAAEPTTGVYIKEFKTLAPEMVDMTFDITISNMASGTFTLNVDPSRDDVSYFYDFNDKDVLENIDLAQNVQAFLTDVMRKAYLFGQTWDQALAEVVTYGTDSYTYEGVINNRECIAYAVGVDLEGNVCSEVSQIDFETFDNTPDEYNEIKGEVIEVGTTDVRIQFTTTTTEPYCVVYAPTARFDGMSQAEKEDLILNFFSKEIFFTGNAEYYQMWLDPETAYSVFAFGWNNGLTTKGLTEVNFTTLPPSDPSQLTFEFAVESITTELLTLSCTGTPSDAFFVYGIAGAEAGDQDVIQGLQWGYQTELAYGNVSSYAEYINKIAQSGKSTGYFSIFQGISYRPYAVGVNLTTGEMAQDIFWGDVIQAPEGARSETELTIEFDKYYDVEDVYNKYPESYAAHYTGLDYYLLPVDVVIHDKMDETNFYYKWIAVYESHVVKDVPDWEMIYSLTNSSSVFLHNEWYLEYDKDYTILAVAAQWGRNYTQLYRRDVNLSKSGASPLGDFVPDEILHPENHSVESAANFDVLKDMNPFCNIAVSVNDKVDTDIVDRMQGRIVTDNTMEQEVSGMAERVAMQNNKQNKSLNARPALVSFNGRVLNAAEKSLLK